MFHHVLQPILWASTAVWIVVGLLPLGRRVFKSPGGWAFALMAFCLAAYSLLDSFRLGATTAEDALLYLRLTAGVATLAPLFLLLFAKWIGVQRRIADLLLALPTLGVLVLVWTAMTPSVQGAPWGFAPVRDPLVYPLWIAYLYGYATLGLYFLWRAARGFRTTAKAEYVKLMGVISSLAAVLIAGAIVLVGVGESGSPLVSSVLIVPGVALILFLAPITSETLPELVRRATRARQDILHAFLIYHGGSLIASRSLEGHSMPDEDIFSAVLEAIQRFMNVSFPVLGGGWLDAIDHHDLKILTERGGHCFLVLVTSGREDDLLRGEMRDVLQRFEERNAEVLVQWDGDPESTVGAPEAVSFFFELDQVF